MNINNSILVNVDLSQREEMVIAGSKLKTGKGYNDNFRERNPVIAYVQEGCKEIPTGSNIVCNYSYFDLESPLQMFDGIYSIPVDQEIFAIVNENGSLTPVCGNVLVERIIKKSVIEMPEERKKPYINQGYVSHGNVSGGNMEGKHIFWLPFSDYEICYNWNGQEYRAIKIHESEIVGYLKN